MTLEHVLWIVAVWVATSVPGQGVLVVVAGLVLMDLPGRRWLLLKLLGRRSTLPAINQVRARLGRRPLLPADAAPQKTRGPVAMPDATRRRVR